jgi:hypothetical protein
MGLMKIAMVSCQQAALLGAKKAFNALSPWEALKFRMHSKMCGACKSLGEDSTLIDKAVEKILEQKEKQNLKLSDVQKAKILDAINS